MVKVDRRDEHENGKATYPYLVVGTDTFMSGWGGAQSGASYAAWACTAAEVEDVFAMVSSRKEMKRVRVVYDPKGAYRPLCAHLSIYVYNGATRETHLNRKTG